MKRFFFTLVILFAATFQQTVFQSTVFAQEITTDFNSGNIAAPLPGNTPNSAIPISIPSSLNTQNTSITTPTTIPITTPKLTNPFGTTTTSDSLLPDPYPTYVPKDLDTQLKEYIDEIKTPVEKTDKSDSQTDSSDNRQSDSNIDQEVKTKTTQPTFNDDALLLPLAPKVKNYLEDGKTSPAYDLKGAGNVQLLEVGPKRISDIIFSFMGVISILVALRAGVSVLFSKGDATKFKNGIMAIIYAAIGIVLIGSAWIIVRLVLDINLGT